MKLINFRVSLLHGGHGTWFSGAQNFTFDQIVDTTDLEGTVVPGQLLEQYFRARRNREVQREVLACRILLRIRLRPFAGQGKPPGDL